MIEMKEIYITTIDSGLYREYAVESIRGTIRKDENRRCNDNGGRERRLKADGFGSGMDVVFMLQFMDEFGRFKGKVLFEELKD